MIFRDFGDNNVCVARLTPNYFEYFVHIDSSSFLCILAQEIILARDYLGLYETLRR